MRLSALIAISLLSLPVHAAKVTPFNQHCLESESIVVSMQGQPGPVIVGEACQYGQLTAEDLSYVESVQPVGAVRKIAERPAQAKPARAVVEISGEACQYGQLTAEDLSYVESVQPVGAVRKIAERPAQAKPAKAVVEISGEACQYGQLTAEDLSYVESVQPVGAVRRISSTN